MGIMELGAIGELVGGVAVIATLIYLALQVRQNSDAIRRSNDYAQASSIQDSNSLYVRVFSQLSQDAELASIYHRATTGEPLDEVETTRFGAFANSFMAYSEALYHQHLMELGFSSEFDKDELIGIWGTYLRKLLKTDAGNSWWSTDAPHLYSPEFVAAVNRALLDAQ